VAVLLPDRTLSARKRPHPVPRDGFGQPIPAGLAAATPAYPGAAREQTERGSWSLRADVRLWPLNPGDELTDGTTTWVVESALKQVVPGYDDVDFIQVIAVAEPPEAI
jgi:hypothetical protein